MLTANVPRNRAARLSVCEKAVLESVVSQTRTCDAGEIVVRQGVPVQVSTLLVAGFMTRHFDVPDGGRHPVALHVPGDFVDLHAHAPERLDHDVGALAAARPNVPTRARATDPSAVPAL